MYTYVFICGHFLSDICLGYVSLYQFNCIYDIHVDFQIFLSIDSNASNSVEFMIKRSRVSTLV